MTQRGWCERIGTWWPSLCCLSNHATCGNVAGSTDGGQRTATGSGARAAARDTRKCNSELNLPTSDPPRIHPRTRSPCRSCAWCGVGAGCIQGPGWTSAPRGRWATASPRTARECRGKRTASMALRQAQGVPLPRRGTANRGSVPRKSCASPPADRPPRERCIRS
eukprot:COSAG02_NODE_1229_length_13775_cov_35.321512_5_plen_165_part_00